MQYLLLSKDPYIGQKENKEINVIKTKFTAHRKKSENKKKHTNFGDAIMF